MATISPPRLRSPLSDTTNSRRSRSSSAFDTAKTNQSYHVRPKVSARTFDPDADSSEDEWSDHSSIYTALRLSSTEALDIERRINSEERSRNLTGPSPPAPEGYDVSPSGCSMSPLDKLNRPPGSPLETITEQKSIATLRASQSLGQIRSLDLSSTLRLGRGTSASYAVHARRKHSFSAGDLVMLKEDKPSSSEATSSDIIPEVIPAYASPKLPLFTPPYRVPTPPGMPHWTGISTDPLPAQTRGRFFSLMNPLSSSHSHMHLPAGRFRPPASGHTTHSTLESHPFHNAPLASVIVPQEPSQEQTLMSGAGPEGLPVSVPRHVRFTSSVVGGDDGVLANPSRPETNHRDLAAKSFHTTMGPRQASIRTSNPIDLQHYSVQPSLNGRSLVSPKGPRKTGLNRQLPSSSKRPPIVSEPKNVSCWEFCCFCLCCGVSGDGEEHFASAESVTRVGHGGYLSN